VRFGGKSEVRWVTIESRQCTRRGHRDGVVEFFRLEQLGPETFRMSTNGLNLDPTATSLRRQDFDRLSPMRSF